MAKLARDHRQNLQKQGIDPHQNDAEYDEPNAPRPRSTYQRTAQAGEKMTVRLRIGQRMVLINCLPIKVNNAGNVHSVTTSDLLAYLRPLEYPRAAGNYCWEGDLATRASVHTGMGQKRVDNTIGEKGKWARHENHDESEDESKAKNRKQAGVECALEIAEEENSWIDKHGSDAEVGAETCHDCRPVFVSGGGESS
ncbi:hypothetical protein EDB83DRAFT_2322887 [Lactarius deliciosus]|nr:hypothetical protein EDB83DRAFT_2322870 [Lactarius deliciosus]KAH9008931.1 hypothetical protein EDB83DRAFT_2322887 [Lactarius deliciosus]